MAAGTAIDALLTENQYAEASAMLAAGRMLSIVARHFNIRRDMLEIRLCQRGLVSRTVRVDVLSPRQREVWDLHIGGMHSHQIADQLRMSKAHVAADLNRARRNLGRCPPPAPLAA